MDKLGLTVVEQSEAGIFLSAGGGTMLFIYPRPGGETPSHTLAEFQVENIEGLIADLTERGVVLEDYDFPGLKTVNHIAQLGPYRVAWLKDLDGNILAVNER